MDAEKEEGWCKKEKLGGTWMRENTENRWKEWGQENKVWKKIGKMENGLIGE